MTDDEANNWARLIEAVNFEGNAFAFLRELPAGVAYHYTTHAQRILELGEILGRPIDYDIDCTQHGEDFLQYVAMERGGVVFAYESRDDANEEGPVFPATHILEIEYERALLAEHVQEASLGAPPTVLILSTDISGFRDLGIATRPW